MNKIIAALLAGSCAMLQVQAQQKLNVKSISIFKNGKSFVVKEGTVSTNDKVYVMKEIPDALYGTLWFSGLQSDIMKVVSKQDTVTESTESKATTFGEILYANKGKQITITTNNNTTYTGVVEDFSFSETTKPKGAAPSDDGANQSSKFFPSFTRTVLIKTSGKWVTINPNDVRTIEFADKPTQTLITTQEKKKPVIKIFFTQGGEQKLNMMYLENGISWAPVYALELLSDTEARLKLQAEVSNNAEDIVNTEINFVVGVPNFKFANAPATLTSFVEKLVRSDDYSAGYLSNAIVSSQQYRYRASEAVKDEEAAAPPMENVDAQPSEDLHFYNLKNVSLENGARAHYQLLNTTIKIKHFYECSLPASNAAVYNSDDDNANSDNDYSFNTQYCNVYHTIELKNDTQSPFTTGPVMITTGPSQTPLAQDMIKYTGKGLTSCIQLTEAPDVRVEEKEKIIATSKDIKKKDGYTYNMVTMQGEVTVVNSKAKEIELHISKNIAGKIQAASIKYQSSSRIIKNDTNPATNLKFEIKVKQGEKTKFTYTYQVLTRNS
ncbi:MAG: DUF4139 domain-containing protein [Filimonas sp.]|nr:DUF4139 domain-containing protein [Filimonas sp.]